MSEATPKSTEAQPNARMYVAIVTAMIGAIMFGVDCGNFGSVQGFASFTEDWCSRNDNYGNGTTCGPDLAIGAAANTAWQQDFISWASMLLFVGAAAGCLLLAPLIANGLGRRPCICVGAVICFIGCLMTSYLSFLLVPIFFIGRFVTGFGIGVCTFALPIYNSEVSTPAMRGATGSLFQVNVVFGQLLASIVTYFVQDWQLGMMLPGFAAIIVAGAVWLAPESPRYVMLKQGREVGAEVLALVRSGDATAEVEEVMKQIEEEEEAGQVNYLELFRNPGLRKRVLIACWLQIAQQFTGMNALIMYSAKLFLEMGFENPFAPNMAFTALQVVGIIAGLFLLDSKFGGRRLQLLIVTATIIPLLVGMGSSVAWSWGSTLMLVIVCAFAFDWQLAWGMIPWVYPSEMFSMSERDRATSLAVLVQYAANALLVLVEPMLEKVFGNAGLFLFFGAFNVLNLAFVVFCIKETKGVPLEDVPALFESPPRTKSFKDPEASVQADPEADPEASVQADPEADAMAQEADPEASVQA